MSDAAMQVSGEEGETVLTKFGRPDCCVCRFWRYDIPYLTSVTPLIFERRHLLNA